MTLRDVFQHNLTGIVGPSANVPLKRAFEATADVQI